MSTKGISTSGLLRERFLADTDVDPEIVILLRKLGFLARSAHKIKCVNDDTQLLKWARRNGYILVCHDRHKDTKTKHAFYAEMYRRGGHVIRVTQPPSQSPLLTLAKILIHRSNWLAHFQEESGEFVAPAFQEGSFKSAGKLYERITQQQQLPFCPESAIIERHPLKSHSRRKSARVLPEATLI